ncbi:MAG: PAS domain-containing protein [Planctomycetes bacterium]|nr:PAS domain-containing protein [Planctomycetota bacterium]
MSASDGSKRLALGWIPLALGIWLAAFGGYEIVERTLLAGAEAELLHWLHIARGAGVSFLVAVAASWYVFRRGARGATAPPGERPEVFARESELRERRAHAGWIVRLRWVAIAAVLLTAFLCRDVLGILSDASTLALVVVAVAMTGYNVLFSIFPPERLAGTGLTFAQVFLDLAALTVMLYFAGGAQNPFVLFYLFHIVIAGILLGPRPAYLVTLAACTLFAALAVLPAAGWLPSFPLGGEAAASGVATDLQVAGAVAAFFVTAFGTAYFATTIVEELRRRGVEILEAHRVASLERAKTEDIVRSIGAGLLILDAERHVVWANEIARRWLDESAGSGLCVAGLSHPATPCPVCPLALVTQGGVPVTCERPVTIGGAKRHYLLSVSSLRSDGGDTGLLLVLIQDVTLMKEMEENLLRAGKLAAVGEFAAGVAHEINNPLAIVASSSEILAGVATSGGPDAGLLERHLKKIEESVFRCKEILRNLLDFSRFEEGGCEAVDAEALLAETARLLEGTARSRQRRVALARTEHPPGSLVLPRSRSRPIQQVVLNLLFNAFDATRPGGAIELSATPRPGGVEIAVADDGCGIPAEILPRIFEPFFTTKPAGKGTGLGLYLSRQIVESLGGEIAVEGRGGGGSVFRMRLPGVAPEPGRAVPTARRPRP